MPGRCRCGTHASGVGWLYIVERHGRVLPPVHDGQIRPQCRRRCRFWLHWSKRQGPSCGELRHHKSLVQPCCGDLGLFLRHEVVCEPRSLQVHGRKGGRGGLMRTGGGDTTMLRGQFKRGRPDFVKRHGRVSPPANRLVHELQGKRCIRSREGGKRRRLGERCKSQLPC